MNAKYCKNGISKLLVWSFLLVIWFDYLNKSWELNRELTRDITTHFSLMGTHLCTQYSVKKRRDYDMQINIIYQKGSIGLNENSPTMPRLTRANTSRMCIIGEMSASARKRGLCRICFGAHSCAVLEFSSNTRLLSSRWVSLLCVSACRCQMSFLRMPAMITTFNFHLIFVFHLYKYSDYTSSSLSLSYFVGHATSLVIFIPPSDPYSISLVLSALLCSSAVSLSTRPLLLTPSTPGYSISL